MARACGHCGQPRAVEHLSQIRVSSKRTDFRHLSGAWDYYTTDHLLEIECCSECGGLTFSTHSYTAEMQDPSEVVYRQLYPKRKDRSDLPERIGVRYEEMLKLQWIPDSFAVGAGRLLEAVCSDMAIKGRNLDQRLKKLVETGTLPQQLADQADLVRHYRNLGGHDDEIDVAKEDVPLIREFVESLLEFLYWGPAKLERGRSALATRRGLPPTEP
jgi:hypothetical protein